MTKKKSAPKKIVSKKSVCCKNHKCFTENPNFLVILLASSIIAFAFLFKFL
ncbi:MAG: hypothetical protein PHE32_03670 [Candidatus Shapirobacteria bacterium]|nr:hypothetical protein [Candidatus Shapirobacteria bacterium]MDD4410773.1 hypothetical protein [Candidatus Shapirobacteria bacterium]